MPDSRGLQVFTSAQLTPLRDHFVQRLRDDPFPPRELETIVVQSPGMRRWLTLQLADALGCAGSLELPFPAHFSHEIAVQIVVRLQLRRVWRTMEGTLAAREASSRKSGECPSLRGRRAYGRLGGSPGAPLGST